MKLFEYAVIYHAKQTKAQQEAGEAAKSELIVPITAILARDPQEVTLIAARGIPEKYLDKLSQVEVACRPF